MDPFEIDTVKEEKAIAMKRYRQIRKIAILFRFLEACLALFFLSWFSTRLPVAVKISGDYFRHISVVVVSPFFVFLVGNAIILTLVVKSGQFSGHASTGNSSGGDLYDEFLKNSENRHKMSTDSPPSSSPEEVVYEDKSVCVVHSYADMDKDTDTDPKRPYQRSFSEKLRTVEKMPELRRSETEIVWRVDESSESAADLLCSESDMSNDEEFRRKIEAFIAKQQRFQREESMAIVLQNLS
ncbi:uncharacterized protein LOC131237940 [Magnolia sinica]|uniref:uncharacterized protein LOC131237940 n=1 Tax=Magnolia sinica TaxID=86752 RepID=UPI00265B1859|nr:uncharacterized protein LOC131237940 [Magnolia sinica]